MPKYDSYKESGVEWLGEIPEHWSLIPNKRIFNLKKKLVGKRSSEYDLLSLTLKGIIKRDMDNPEGKFPAEFDTYQEVSSGDFVFCLFDVEETPRTVGLSKFDGMITGAYTVFNPSEQYSREFLYYFYLNLDTDKKLKPLYKGLRNTISKEAFFSFKTFAPPINEQVKIAKYLDRTTAQIDEAIAIKQKQIELLKEHKQIIIQQAVTQGLNPDAPMKDSGVDWIGEIPEHWGIVRFKNLFTQSRLPVRKGDGVVTSYRDGQVTLRSNRRVGGYTEAILEGGYQGIRKGQLVLNSMDAFEGAIGVSDSDGKCTPEYVICDPINRVDVSQYYFAYLLREMALAKYIQVICNAVRQRAVRIRYNNLAPLFMVVPPVKEQEDIVSFIEKESAKLDAGIKHLNEQISKLKEYKATLINSAVTGKIKVTELA
ncbi:restriction endonuclease subunit S [Vibrio parahaemolyticus]|nr:restriction endonuclease subunit S [Vibrio parahaemolyticus]TOF45244.1 restriction endonuclease subunit S [Vibrio parahaemolyticus]